jgi:hypothetical protein
MSHFQPTTDPIPNPSSAPACADCDDRGWHLRDGRIQPCQCGTYDPPKWVRNGDPPCLVAHFKDPDRPRRAHVGWLCRGHYGRLEQMIAELPSLYDDLGRALTSSEKPNGDGGKSKHSQVAGGVSLNDPIVAARDEIKLECWRMAHEVAEGADVDLPTTDTVNAICAWLLHFTGWYANQDDADVTYRILDRLARDSRSLVSPSGRQKIPVTKRTGKVCQTVLLCDVATRKPITRCGGDLTAILTGSGWGDDEGTIKCERCDTDKPINLVALAEFEDDARCA